MLFKNDVWKVQHGRRRSIQYNFMSKIRKQSEREFTESC